MIYVDITITGPGSVINCIGDPLNKLLQDLGATVKIKNEYPAEKGLLSPTNLNNFVVNVQLNHCPWGG